MKQGIFKSILLAGVVVLVAACNNNSGVSQADLDAVRMLAEEAKTMAAEARDIALRAEQKADQAMSQ
jgi:hypothetical protein